MQENTVRMIIGEEEHRNVVFFSRLEINEPSTMLLTLQNGHQA